MPELPEVETTRRGIMPHLVNSRVKNVLVRQAMLRWPVSPELGQVLTGQKIVSVDRRGKYLFLSTEAGRMMIHLGMSGSLRILDIGIAPEKHDHIDVMFDSNKLLRFRDPRRFGSVFWLPTGESHVLLERLGPEPLEKDFDTDYLFKQSRKRKLAIKQFLMTSQIVVGVGNIYANEALFMAGINPEKSAGKVSKKKYAELVQAVKFILAKAIEAGGTTLQDFVREDGSPGYFEQQLNVYGRGGEACVQCGKILKEIRLGQRTTVFCASCQR
ncbi:MAG: bifunctional DNA-formamidopyrimidine glycosylase/DNA-(apurinic or apyrimidinic site) lyase [Pseudomonadales bacterium]|nr:bifunctional DNA-formamidopyrimidine glycosylase/DNA-(apurinic or apyrimidinic site) lyase [Pseudomonadales bacterium]